MKFKHYNVTVTFSMVLDEDSNPHSSDDLANKLNIMFNKNTQAWAKENPFPIMATYTKLELELSN